HRGHGVSYFEGVYNTVYAAGSAVVNYPGQFIADSISSDKDTYNDNFTAAVGHTIEEGTGFVITAMILSLLSVFLTYKSLLNLGSKEKTAIFSVLVGYFSSYTIWYVFLNSAFNHTTEVFGLSLLLYSISRYKNDNSLRYHVLAGIGIGIATLARPPLLIAGLIYGLYLISQKRFKAIVALALGGIPLALMLISYNITSYGSPFAASYTLLWDQHFDFTLFKQLHVILAPQRGWFVYSPAAFLAVVGLFYKFKNSQKNIFLANLVGATGIIFTIILYGSWPYWWGGGSFGQRFLLSFLPFTIYGISRVIEWSKTWKYTFRKFTSYELTIFSLIIFTLWSLFLTGLYRITPVAGLRPIEDSIGLMESGNRYTPLDMIEYHAKLVIRADSVKDYASDLKSSFSGGTPYPVIWLGYSNVVLRTDTRDLSGFKLLIIEQENGKLNPPEKFTIVLYNEDKNEYSGYTIYSQDFDNQVFRFDCSDECIPDGSFETYSEYEVSDLEDTAKYTQRNLTMYGYIMYVQNENNLFIK
ncbi:glycosyltransferase family 39 protein, partial [Candidatus Dojkabacteria bacterium]|nr:glycosyltransferase family 39 protein [Candidatus Dojkabacteria bacterium]